MRRTAIGIGVILIVLSSAPHSFGGGKQQIDDMNAQIRSGLPIPVQNHKGQEVGQVVALASNKDEIAYFIVIMNGSEGGFVPIPFSEARYDPQINAVVLPDKAVSGLAQAPPASPDEAQRPRNPALEGPVQGYYGQEPGQQEPGTGMDSEEDMRTEEGSVNI